MKRLLLLLSCFIISTARISAESIAELRALFTGTTTTIPAGWQISGVVISDIANANTDPKNMILQDSTAGMVVRFTANHSFALNARVNVNIAGYTIIWYHGLLEISNLPLNKATQNGTGSVTPRLVSIGEIAVNSSLWQSTLLQIPCASFLGPAPYSGNQQVTDNTGTITMYTRTAASFASSYMPTGNVNVTGILGCYDNPELEIRNTTDVVSGCTAYNPVTLVHHSLAELRALYNGSNVMVNRNWKVSGIVISERVSQNFDNQTLVLQDPTAGIVIRFTDSHMYNIGDDISLIAGGRLLASNAGCLELDLVEDAGTTFGNSGSILTRVAAISEIRAHSSQWQSTLLQIPCTLITGPTSNYGGTCTLTDATGSLDLYTRQGASFSSSSFPIDTVNLIGILSNHNGDQFVIRNLNDVQYGCIPHTVTGIQEVLPEALEKETKYFDVLGREIKREQCTICIAKTGNTTKKVALAQY